MSDNPSYLRRSWKKPLMEDCVKTLRRDGWNVYTRGFPTVVAEKGCFLRLILISPKVVYRKGVLLGKSREALSEAFYKCFGVRYEIWDNAEEPKKDNEWI